LAIASFRGKVFQVSAQRKYTLSGMEWGGSLDTEAQDKLKDKPSTFIKGESLSTLSFEVPLRADFGVDVRKEIEAWEAIKSAAKPDIFILGSKPIGKHKWLLKSVNVSDVEIDSRGLLLKATLKLEFEEYVRAGKASASSLSSIASSRSAMSPRTYLKPTSYVKAEQKRRNPNVTVSLQSGPRRISQS
jgi:hypothetical protein